MATRSPKDNTANVIPGGAGYKIGIVVSDWHRAITDKLLSGCRESLIVHHVSEEDIQIIRVPGSFELPMGAKLLLGRERLDAIICLGCVIKGETKHDEYISQSVANGIMNLSLMSNTPVIFGVLTPNSIEQAEDRAGGTHGNKGIEAAETALRMVTLRKEVGRNPHKIGFA
ncbi:MAG TPA: 6,7-dimethyl-8-ribityllumazine synthase [Saprospiraceae bacterium]|nr:6,7-dimethyl-8-ribityllumazine synthase [Saprospiraceae bacterium]